MATVAIPVALAVAVGAAVAITSSFRTSVNDAALNCASSAGYAVPAAATATAGTGTVVPAAAATTSTTAAPTTAATATTTAAATTSPTAAATAATTAATTTAATATTTTAAATTSTAAATATTTASTTPCPTATAAAAAVNPEAGTADLALTAPVDPAGNAINLNQSAAQAANSMNCTLTVPASPLTAQGLATPWQLGDGCSMANAGTEGAFVEATILSPGGQVQIYDPLVITQGTTPAVTPAAPTIAAGSQVIINVGFNGNNLVLEGAGAAQGNCIDAFGNSIIAQTSTCNAAAFYADANAQIAAGTLTVPALGTDSNGQACESTQSFSLIDQDQSDNVLSSYLINGNGQTAQNTAANANTLAGATTVSNGSDNGLLGHFVDPALGCTPFTATDSTSPKGTDGSQALNVLSARQNQQGTIALLPVNDPQLLVAGQFSVGKTNTYRALSDQTPLVAPVAAGAAPALAADVASNRIAALQGQLTALTDRNATLMNQVTVIQGRGLSAANQAAQIAPVSAEFASVSNQIASVNNQIAALQSQANGGSLAAFTTQNAASYCQDMVNIQPAKLQGDMAKELNFTSPVPATGNNLATFLGARLSASFTNLNCQNFGLTNPVTVTVDGNGVATAVTYNTTQQIAKIPAAAATATTGATATAPASATSTGATATATPAATSTAAPANGPGTAYNRAVPSGRRGHKENGAGM